MEADNGTRTLFTRDTDRWLRRWALLAPVVSGLVGMFIGTAWGFLAAAYLYKDHEKRINALEQFKVERVAVLEKFKETQSDLHKTIAETLSAIQEHIRIDERMYPHIDRDRKR